MHNDVDQSERVRSSGATFYTPCPINFRPSHQPRARSHQYYLTVALHDHHNGWLQKCSGKTLSALSCKAHLRNVVVLIVPWPYRSVKSLITQNLESAVYTPEGNRVS